MLNGFRSDFIKYIRYTGHYNDSLSIYKSSAVEAHNVQESIVHVKYHM